MLSRVLSRMFNVTVFNELRNKLITLKPKLVKKDYQGIEMLALMEEVNNAIKNQDITFPLAFDIINSELPLEKCTLNYVYCKLIETYKKDINLRNLNLLLSLFIKSPPAIQTIYASNKLFFNDFLVLVKDSTYSYDIIGILYSFTKNSVTKNWIFLNVKNRNITYNYIHFF